ncbi:MAG: PEP-CTERM sorting domain-containing protein [Phycisphaeraceae bacterium]|nr:PEP-CTERM sorting domain-containing protein [Phycisphaeraceae bacterium]
MSNTNGWLNRGVAMAVALGVGGLFSADASAAIYADSIASGPGQTVNFTNISDNFGLYGGYNRSGDALTWLPQNFKAESADGVSQNTNDVLLMTITAQPGDWLTKIEVFEVGDRTFSGPSGGYAQTTASGTLFVTELAPGGGLAGFDSFSQVFNLDDGFGLWNGSLVVDLTGMQITSVQISWQNNLQATSEPGTASLIQKKFGELGIAAEVIPEPASISLLGLGGLLLLRRRR